MANEVLGVDILIKVSGTVVAGQTDCSLSFKSDEIDTSTKTNKGWKSSKGGLKEASISLDAVNYVGEKAVSQRALRKAYMDSDEVQVVAVAGLEEVYFGPANILGLDISGSMTDKSMSSFSLKGSDEWDYEFAPKYVSAAIDETKKIVTITFDETVLNNLADVPALKAATTIATDGTTFAALGESDSVAITDGKLVVTFNAALTTATNKINIAASSLKTTNGAIQTVEQTTDAISAL